MKISINSLSWDYKIVQSEGGEVENICIGTNIDTEVFYPKTEKFYALRLTGTVRCAERICDMGEARKIVKNIITQNKGAN